MKGSPVRFRASALESPSKSAVSVKRAVWGIGDVPTLSRRGEHFGTRQRVRSVVGRVMSSARVRGPVSSVKFRLSDGRRAQTTIGPAWTELGRLASGYFTKRLVEDWLATLLDQARRGTLPGMVQTGATFADAGEEWLRDIEHDRGREPSTVRGCRSIVGSELLPTSRRWLESITAAAIESWQASMTQAPSTRTKALVLMHGIYERARKVWSLPSNPVSDVEKPLVPRSGDLRVFSPREVWALARAAANGEDGSSVRVRVSYYAGHLTTPKSGKVRAVPLAPDVARLVRLSHRSTARRRGGRSRRMPRGRSRSPAAR